MTTRYLNDATVSYSIFYTTDAIKTWLPSAMVARLASIAKWHQKVAGSSPAVVIFTEFIFFLYY